MGNYYISEGEREYLAKRKADAEATELWVKEKNLLLVGDVKTYKGIRYQMQQRGTFVCLGLPVGSPFDGHFTTALTLHKIIDDMEVRGSLPK